MAGSTPEHRATFEDRAVTIALVIGTVLSLLRVFRSSRDGQLDGEFALAMVFLLLGALLLGSEIYEGLTRRT